MAILSQALFSVMAATEPLPARASTLIRLTRIETRRLLALVIAPTHDIDAPPWFITQESRCAQIV